MPYPEAPGRRNRRILHVSQPVDDGVAMVVGDLTQTLVDQGWEVVVACPNRGYLPDRVAGAGASHVAWEASREPGAATLAELRSLARIISRCRPDVVHLHSSKAGLVGRLAVRGRIPTVFSPHAWSFFHVEGLKRRTVLQWERRGSRWADVILCGSQGEAQSGRAEGIRGQFRVISNTSRMTNPGWTQSEARARMGLEDVSEAPIAVCFGRYARQKGQDVLLSAWPGVVSRVPEARLILVGSGPEEAQLRRCAPHDVLFRSAGDRRSVAGWILSADVLVFPSRWETLSLAVLEALELGRPVVVSDCQGMAEALHGGAGVMVPREDSAALAQAVGALLEDREGAARLGGEAAQRFANVHRVRRERNMREYETLLVGLVDGT